MNDVWHLLQDCDRYVYHYTRARTLATKILPRAKLKFSRFQDVNDPRESKDWFFNFSYRTPIDFDSQAWTFQLNRHLKHACRIGCFVVDPQEAQLIPEAPGKDVIEAMCERGHSRPRMWAQYAENYAGACLVFDKTKLDRDIRSVAAGPVFAGKVTYRNLRTTNLWKPDPLMINMDEVARHGYTDALEAHVATHWRELFFLKASDWSQEREYRWVVTVNTGEDFLVDVNASLVGILLGDRFPTRYKRPIAKFIRATGVKLATMQWKNGVPQPAPDHWRLLLPRRPWWFW